MSAFQGPAPTRPDDSDHATVLDATTGEILRALTLDATRTYQPQETTRPEPPH